MTPPAEAFLSSMRNQILAVFFSFTVAGAQAPPPNATETPEALVAQARECIAGEDPVSCLVPHVAERVYFFRARDLREASDACAEAYRVAQEGDGGHGWYHTPEDFLACHWTAEAPYREARDILPRDILLECITAGELVILGDEAARLVTSRFMWEMRKEDGRWVFAQLLLKP